MGWNTTVFILNDRLREIKADPQRFVDELVNAINSMEERKEILGNTTVMRSYHADEAMVYFTGRNTITNISLYPNKYDSYLETRCHAAILLVQNVLKELKRLNPTQKAPKVKSAIERAADLRGVSVHDYVLGTEPENG